MSKKYLIVIEETETGFSAYCPDLPGCVATGDSQDEVEQTMKEALEFHLDGMKGEGIEIPPPKSYSTYHDIEAA